MKEIMFKYVRRLTGKDQALAQDNSKQDKPKQDNNTNIRLKQLRMLVAVILAIALLIGGVVMFLGKKKQSKTNKESEEPILKVELADKNLDPEKHWRNYFEEKQEHLIKDVDLRLAEIAKTQAQALQTNNQRIEEELQNTKAKLAMAQRELASASLDLKRVASSEQKRAVQTDSEQSELAVQEFNNEVEYDRPKSVKNYIPEGTYFTGHLLGGIAVSTGLNTPDENATPVTLKLIKRSVAGRSTTNLSPLNKLQLENCRIIGSSYGDLSSERAIIRLEKMVCEQDGVYITSKIAGQIFGPDGLNGVKGTIVSTSSKHVMNAAIGGVIGGVSSAAKGQDSALVNPAGMMMTKKKGAKSLLAEGGMQGVSSAGDKIADYYLRQAEAMSPILTVPSGVRINAQITKGFFVGEVGTHKKIKAARKSNSYNSSTGQSEYME
jgi:hypothetical protein